MSNQKRPRIAIIGAGITGITVARALAEAGHEPTIFEKSRGLGGRLSTRISRSGVQFDHGGQYLTARGDGFAAFLNQAVEKGSGGVWASEGSSNGSERIVGTPRMNALLSPFAHALDTRFQHTILPLTRSGRQWALRVEETGDTHLFDYVVITTPSVQARALIENAEGALAASLASVDMVPCWALMVAFDTPLETALTTYRDAHKDIAWIARDSTKPGRNSAIDQWVIHASPAWSISHLEEDKQTVAKAFLSLSTPIFGCAMPVPIYSAAHRWRYAMAATPLGDAFIKSEDQTLLVGGDWCLGARAEDGFGSAMALARHLTNSLAA
ncbi:MAG: FAD-dependent oxidoreductase [Pseudomonadota bacterium]